MKDLNFFEDYIEKTEVSIDRQLILSGLALIIAIILLIFILFNQIKIRQLSKNVSKLQTIAKDERIIKKVKEVEEKQKELDSFNKSLGKIRILDSRVEEESIVDNYLLDSINLKMPEDVFFTSINMRPQNIQIVGNGKDKWSIAQFAKNLETIDDFHEIFISNISSEEGYYNFVLNISLKDVNMDEEGPADEEDEVQEVDGE